METYRDKKDEIAQALDVTFQEAIEQALLPYSVDYFKTKGNRDLDKVKVAMLAEGGFEVNGSVELRFPTREMAIASVNRLYEKIPGIKWGWGLNG